MAIIYILLYPNPSSSRTNKQAHKLLISYTLTPPGVAASVSVSTQTAEVFQVNVLHKLSKLLFTLPFLC